MEALPWPLWSQVATAERARKMRDVGRHELMVDTLLSQQTHLFDHSGSTSSKYILSHEFIAHIRDLVNPFD
jgi:hypothetical protein